MPTVDEQIADLSRELSAALKHASALVDAENFGDELRRVVQKARLLHGILETRIAADEAWMADELSVVGRDTEGMLDRLEALVVDSSPPEV